MTWQRIDENTYIDDTLVTCAEYQLFIDEMREQGKFYQPDHWNSYQFPEGHARKPILGVRHSDVEEFCKWLIKREISEWYFRMPTEAEANEYPLLIDCGPLSFGYWIVSVDDDYPRFLWKSHISNDARELKIDLTIKEDRGPIRNLDRKLGQAINRNLNYDRTYAITFTLDAIKYNLAFVKDHNHNYTYGLVSFLDLDRSFILDNSLELAFNKIRDLARARVGARTRTISQTINLTRNRDHDLNLIRNLNTEIDIAHELAMKLFADIFTLRERIAGRSPAFEGIRLVKERIR